ncbi:MAG: hypothetical protein LBM99_00835, partial [Bacillales bacterium]|nr:hypothetical protein [Bacillales bacterium]
MKKNILRRILTYLLGLTFLIRLLFDKPNYFSNIGLNGNVLNVFLYLSITLYVTSFLMLFLFDFYKTRFNDYLLTYFVLPSLIIYLSFSFAIIPIFTSGLLYLLLYILEIVLFTLLLTFNLIRIFKNKTLKKLDKNSIIWLIIIIVVCLLVNTQPYVPQAVFGKGNQVNLLKDFKFVHRLLIYGSLLLPIFIYLAIKDKSIVSKRLALIYMTLACTLSYSSVYTLGELFTNIASWPFHLCNTAMYIIPICLTYKVNWLFYFTYFINVLGAFLAILLPSYDAVYLT